MAQDIHWKFNGDGTATAQAGATLKELAKFLTGGDETAWKQFKGYTNADKISINQTIDYSALIIYKIPLKIFIVDGSAHTPESVKGRIKEAISILHSHGILLLFDPISIEKIEPKTKNGVDLLNIELIISEDKNAIEANRKLVSTEKGITLDGKNEVDLLDPDGKTFIQIYTNKIINKLAPRSLTITQGAALPKDTTAVLSINLDNTTLAHELCHNFDLDHIEITGDKNNLMYPSIENKDVDKYLDDTQVAKIKNYLKGYPHKSNI